MNTMREVGALRAQGAAPGAETAPEIRSAAIDPG